MVTLFLAAPKPSDRDAPPHWAQHPSGIMLLFMALLALLLGVYPQPLIELARQTGLLALAN